VSWVQGTLLALSTALFAYLCYAMIKPERF
jgi:K+-transporting ATPase KdpF subunit